MSVFCVWLLHIGCLQGLSMPYLVSIPFHCQIMFPCIVILCFIYPLISWWPFGRYSYTSFCVCGRMFLFLLSICLRVNFLVIYDNSVFNFWGTAYFKFIPPIYDGSDFFTVSNIWYCLSFYCRHLSDMMSHCGSDWYFPSGQWYWTSFHVLSGHL